MTLKEGQRQLVVLSARSSLLGLTTYMVRELQEQPREHTAIYERQLRALQVQPMQLTLGVKRGGGVTEGAAQWSDWSSLLIRYSLSTM